MSEETVMAMPTQEQRKGKGYSTVPPIEAFIQWEQFKEVIFERMGKEQGGQP